MAKERFLTILVPISDADAETTVYASEAALIAAIPPSLSNIDKIYKIEDGTYRRVWNNPTTDTVEYHAVTDREFPYIGKPIEIYDFTYDATRMGSAPTISAQNVMWYAEKDGNGNDITLEGLWSQLCHVSFNGENLYLKQIPTSSKSNEDARYKYDLDFVAERVVLERVYLYDISSPFIPDKPLSESATFSFYGDINELAKRINASMIRSGLATLIEKYVYIGDRLVPHLTYEQWNLLDVNPQALLDDGVFESISQYTSFYNGIYMALSKNYNAYLALYVYEIDASGNFILNGYQCKIGYDAKGVLMSSEEKLISFDKNTIHDALQQFHDTFELQYYITKGKDALGNFTGNTLIMVADCEHDFADWDESSQDFVRDDEGIPTTENPFDYGVQNELLSKEKTNTTEQIVTRITGVGSTENIPWYYPNPNPDGWIKPVYTRDGVVRDDVTIGYPDEEQGNIYEKYLKNRIGRPIKRGVVKSVIYSTEYSFVDYDGDEPRPELGLRVRAAYDVGSKGSQNPILTLELNPNSQLSNCVKIEAKLYRRYYISGGGASAPVSELVDSYSSTQTYSNPTEFQELFIHADGKHMCSLNGQYNYRVEITYQVAANADFSGIYDYEGYHYDATYLENPDVPEPYGTLPRHVFFSPPAYIGEDFYQVEGLSPFAVWGEDFIVAVAEDIVTHNILPTDAGYSTNGSQSGKAENMPRYIGMRYKDINTGVVYRCDVATENTIQTGLPSPAFTENPPFEKEDWVRMFVDMKMTLYANDGWYIGSKKIQLNDDYGIGDPYPILYGIFDAIEFQRTKWVTPIHNLMPEVFIKTDGERRFYNAHNYWDTQNETLLVGTADAMIGEVQVDDKVRNPIYKEEETDTDDKHYDFENEYMQDFPYEHIENFDDVKPSINGQRSYAAVKISKDTISDWANQYQNYFTKNQYGEYTSATSSYDSSETYYMLLRIDVAEAFAYDTYDNDEIWENTSDGGVEGEYKHPYFFVKLRPMGFNIFDLALQEDMVISMTTGHCGACNFRIGVDEQTKKNPVQLWLYDVYEGKDLQTATKVYDKGDLRRYVNTEDLYYDTDRTQSGYKSVNDNMSTISGGMLVGSSTVYPMYSAFKYSGEDVTNGFVGSLKQSGNNRFEGDVVTNGRFIESQQDTTDNYVWVALFKDTETYGTIMPSAMTDYTEPSYNSYIRPKSVADVHTQTSTYEDDEDNADKFVILNIKMPQVYLRRAEHELSRRLVKYMYEHNYQRFNFSINFSRIFIAQNPETDENVNENSVLYVNFNNAVYRQYVKHYSYKMSKGEPLPEISVDMNEELSVTRTLAQQWSLERMRDGSSLSSRFKRALAQSRERIEKNTIGKNDDVVLTGNVVVKDTKTSLIELIGGNGSSGEVDTITIQDIDGITSN